MKRGDPVWVCDGAEWYAGRVDAVEQGRIFARFTDGPQRGLSAPRMGEWDEVRPRDPTQRGTDRPEGYAAWRARQLAFWHGWWAQQEGQKS